MTLGSLFDGSGTCPLAATMCGVTPVWASEIEPYPVAVTTARFPEMKHLGDITKIDGAGKILFEREGLRGDFAQSRAAWESAAGHAPGSAGGSRE